jgi:CDP-diacylglycerol--glycerol-3-phosphate 3-phosphatidyltransferase
MFFVIPIGFAVYYDKFTLSLVLFIIAALTDWLDGFVARKTNTVTDVGKVMDQIADKVLINSVLIFMVDLKMVPSWLVVTIVWRDILVSAVRILAAKKGEIVAANIFGKLKTVFQMTLVIVLLSKDIFRSPLLEISLVWIVFALTVLSMTIYLWENRSVFET